MYFLSYQHEILTCKIHLCLIFLRINRIVKFNLFAKSARKILHFILLKRIMKNTKYFLRLGNACFWPDILHWTCLQDKALWYSEMQLIIQFGLAKGNNHYPRFFRIRWRTIGFKKLNLAIRYHILSTQDICIHILFVIRPLNLKYYYHYFRTKFIKLNFLLCILLCCKF